MEGDSNSVRAPRLCSMARNPQGYGFNLHGEKGVAGQYISAVDRNGPADRAGLCVGDRVVHVNGVNVEEASHAQVVAKIKEDSVKVVLLVVDKVTDEYLSKLGVAITEDLAKHDSVLALTSQGDHTPNGINGEDVPSEYDDEERSTRNDNREERSLSTEEDNDQHVQRRGDDDSPMASPFNGGGSSAASMETSNGHDNISQTQHGVMKTHDDTHRGSDTEKNGYSSPVLQDEQMSHSSDDSTHLAGGGGGDSGRTSADSARLSMAAALPKPRRRQIKEDKSETWASKAALFNNL